MFFRSLTGPFDRLPLALVGLTHVGTRLMSAIDNLTTAVQNATSVEASAVTLINGLADEIKSAASNNDVARVQALADQLSASSSALAAAVSANTPAAAPSAPPAPAAA